VIVTWSVAVLGAGTVTPFDAVTSTAPGEPNGVPVPSKAYADDWYGFDASLLALVPKIAGKATEAMPDYASPALAASEKSPAWSAFSHSVFAAPS
jgi:hypothetical protein